MYLNITYLFSNLLSQVISHSLILLRFNRYQYNTYLFKHDIKKYNICINLNTLARNPNPQI